VDASGRRRSRDAWLATAAPADLGPDERDGVLALAWRVRREERRRGASARVPSSRSLRRRLARRLADDGPTLTESAWAAIATETDPDVLGFLVGVSLIDDLRLEVQVLRRAVLENLPLARHAAAARHDRDTMARIARRAARQT
jgi:hypothetical protein